jgi:hypothetical protein
MNRQGGTALDSRCPPNGAKRKSVSRRLQHQSGQARGSAEELCRPVGVHPAVDDGLLGGFLRPFPIARHHVVPAHRDLADGA